MLIVFTSCKKEVKSVVSESYHSENQSIVSKIIPIKKSFVANQIGDTLDVFNNVSVFYNKSMNNTSGRNVSADGYNIGLKWQCVEFVKRYYYEHLSHKMPNSYGHAKDFFNSKIDDGKLNTERNLIQFTNGSNSKPMVNDLLVFDGNLFNSYGHVAIISKVNDDEIEIVQQNVGRNSRDNIAIKFKNNQWVIDQSDILGWLRKQ